MPGPVPAPIERDDLAALLRTRWVGRAAHLYDRVGSTMDVARSLALDGAADGTIVLAEAQNAGRGRLRRPWHSAPGLGIWCSAILPTLPTPGAIGLLVAASIREAIADLGAPAVLVKWPNDVLAAPATDERPSWIDASPEAWPDAFVAAMGKVAGILVESAAGRLVVGFGINVNHSAEDYPEKLAAMSVARAIGRDVDRAGLLATVLGGIERRIDRARDGTAADGADLVTEWRRWSALVGRDIEVHEGHHRRTVRAVDIQPDGALVVADGDAARPLYAGTVRLVTGST